jgi:hypothetical protein
MKHIRMLFERKARCADIKYGGYNRTQASILTYILYCFAR